MTLEDFRKAVSVRMLRVYALDWHDACGDGEPLLSAMESGGTPEEFVERWGAKFDLTSTDDVLLRSPDSPKWQRRS